MSTSELDQLCRLVDHAVQLRITRNRIEQELRTVTQDLDRVVHQLEKQRAKMFLNGNPKPGTLPSSRDAVGSPPNGQDFPT